MKLSTSLDTFMSLTSFMSYSPLVILVTMPIR